MTYFDLNNFYEFYEALLGYAGVVGQEIEGPIFILPIRNKKNKKNEYMSKSLFCKKSNPSRQFLLGELSYADKITYLVEIQHDPSWTPSTWIFISNSDNKTYELEDFKEIIEYYIKEQINYKELEEYVNRKYQLVFDHKIHIKGECDAEELARWCENVLDKIIAAK